MGAEAIEAPMIRIVPPEDYGPLDEACARAGAFNWVIFASANAVDAFLERLLAGPQDLRALKGVKLCGVGPATAERLARHGLKVDLTPADLLSATVVACIGPVTAEAASQFNIKTTIMPAVYTIPALVDAIVEYFLKPS